MRLIHIAYAAALLSLTACGSNVPPSPKMKIGKPYEIDGKTYYPKYDPDYDKTGMGSWYGPGFHGRKTASGEEFDEQDLTAAHPTLPMPSLVKVTNLKNGKTAIVRINDRGPFKKGRIIDLSRGSAERIGLHSTMKVRVQYLPEETEAFIKDWEDKGKPADMFAYNDKLDAGEPFFAMAAAKQEEEPSRFSIISSAKADETIADGAVTSSDLPPPSSEVRAEKQTEPVVTSRRNSRTNIYEKDADDVPFSRGPSVPAPAEEPSKPPFKANEPVHAVAPTGDELYIQAGTFSSKANAQHLVEKLSELSGATMNSMERGGKQLWRVRVGPFVNRSAANEALGTVQQHVPDAHITH